MINYPEAYGITTKRELCRKWLVGNHRSKIHSVSLTQNLSGFLFLGERYVYKFVCDPEALFNMAYGNSSCSDGHSSPISNCRNTSLTASLTGTGTTAVTERNVQNYYSNYQQLN